MGPKGNPCIPSPCGPNSQCKVVGEAPACSCLPNYIGIAPNCRPECSINAECPGNLACQNEKCVDPCPGSCGFNADCTVGNHVALCNCIPGHTGDPFSGCSVIECKSCERLDIFLTTQLRIYVFNLRIYWILNRCIRTTSKSVQSITMWRKRIV